MANSYKNIVITPNRDTDAANVPFIRFSGGDATTNTDINVRVYTTQSGTLSFEGSAGQLFSITNDLTNTIFSVNDVSGIPSIEVNANGLVTLVPYGGNVGIGRTSANANYRLDVNGAVNASAFFINGVATNIQGIQGIQGNQGIQGTQGIQGIQGIQGVQGTQGIQGIQGRQGIQGANGFQGIQGTQGIQGIQGIQGTTGSQGIQGIQGVQGTQGIQGIQGPGGPSTTINATNVSVNDEVYPVFVTLAGSNQTAQTSPGLTFNPSSNLLSVSGNVEVTWPSSTGRRIGTFFSTTYRQGMHMDQSPRILKLFSTTNAADVGGAITFNTRAAAGVNEEDYGTERMRIDASGNVGIGTNNPTVKLQLYDATAAQFQVIGDSTTQGIFARYSTDATPPILNFRKSRGTFAAPTTAATGDEIGRSNYSAYDGSNFQIAAQIQSFVETFNGTNDVSAYLRFTTRPTGVAGASTERMRIQGSGNVLIGRTDSTVGQDVKLDVAGAVNASALLVNGSALGDPAAYKRANIALARAITA